MGGQQRNEHAKASDGKVEVEQPGQQLERVGGPAPPVGPGAERRLGPVGPVLTHRRRAVWVPAAHVHLALRHPPSGIRTYQYIVSGYRYKSMIVIRTNIEPLKVESHRCFSG